LRDQERKLSKSGLSVHFSHIEIVSEKDPTTYERILRRHGVAPQRFLMVGNSLKSDILPGPRLGGIGRVCAVCDHVGSGKSRYTPEGGRALLSAGLPCVTFRPWRRFWP
jgi:hypothetical protein